MCGLSIVVINAALSLTVASSLRTYDCICCTFVCLCFMLLLLLFTGLLCMGLFTDGQWYRACIEGQLEDHYDMHVCVHLYSQHSTTDLSLWT